MKPLPRFLISAGDLYIIAFGKCCNQMNKLILFALVISVICSQSSPCQNKYVNLKNQYCQDQPRINVCGYDAQNPEGVDYLNECSACVLGRNLTSIIPGRCGTSTTVATTSTTTSTTVAQAPVPVVLGGSSTTQTSSFSSTSTPVYNLPQTCPAPSCSNTPVCGLVNSMSVNFSNNCQACQAGAVYYTNNPCSTPASSSSASQSTVASSNTSSNSSGTGTSSQSASTTSSSSSTGSASSSSSSSSGSAANTSSSGSTASISGVRVQARTNETTFPCTSNDRSSSCTSDGQQVCGLLANGNPVTFSNHCEACRNGSVTYVKKTCNNTQGEITTTRINMPGQSSSQAVAQTSTSVVPPIVPVASFTNTSSASVSTPAGQATSTNSTTLTSSPVSYSPVRCTQAAKTTNCTAYAVCGYDASENTFPYTSSCSACANGMTTYTPGVCPLPSQITSTPFTNPAPFAASTTSTTSTDSATFGATPMSFGSSGSQATFTNSTSTTTTTSNAIPTATTINSFSNPPPNFSISSIPPTATQTSTFVSNTTSTPAGSTSVFSASNTSTASSISAFPAPLPIINIPAATTTTTSTTSQTVTPVSVSSTNSSSVITNPASGTYQCTSSFVSTCRPDGQQVCGRSSNGSLKIFVDACTACKDSTVADFTFGLCPTSLTVANSSSVAATNGTSALFANQTNVSTLSLAPQFVPSPITSRPATVNTVQSTTFTASTNQPVHSCDYIRTSCVNDGVPVCAQMPNGGIQTFDNACAACNSSINIKLYTKRSCESGSGSASLVRVTGITNQQIYSCTPAFIQTCTPDQQPVCALTKNGQKVDTSDSCTACKNPNTVSFTRATCANTLGNVTVSSVSSNRSGATSYYANSQSVSYLLPNGSSTIACVQNARGSTCTAKYTNGVCGYSSSSSFAWYANECIACSGVNITSYVVGNCPLGLSRASTESTQSVSVSTITTGSIPPGGVVSCGPRGNNIIGSGSCTFTWKPVCATFINGTSRSFHNECIACTQTNKPIRLVSGGCEAGVTPQSLFKALP